MGHHRHKILAALLLAVAVAASGSAVAETAFSSDNNGPAPDEISYTGEFINHSGQWSSAYGISYRKIFNPYFAGSIGYLNDGHFPGHFRDGVTGEGWLPIDLFTRHVTLSVGGGLFYYYDTVDDTKLSAGYADDHGWAWIGSLDAMWSLRGEKLGPFIEMRLDYTSPSRSIETFSIGLGIGYRGYSDEHTTPDFGVSEGFLENEIAAYYWKTVVSSFSSQTAHAEAVDYRRHLWKELRGSIGLIHEADTQLVRRSGVTGELWLEPSFNSGLWSIGAGFGGYAAIDKYEPSSGSHISGIVSATLSLRIIKHLDTRFIWHRIVTDYNRDTDILLWGIGYRFE
jgi:hypothetical protein